MSQAEQGVFGALLCIISIISLPSISIFVSRRGYHPVKGRPFRILLFHQIFLYVYTVSLCLMSILPEGKYPCLAEFFVNSLFGIAIATSYTIRVWLLLVRIKLTDAKIALWDGSDPAETDRFIRWLLRHQFLLRERSLWLFYFGFTLLVGAEKIITVFIWLGNGTYQMFGDCDVQHDDADHGQGVYISAVEILLIAVAAWKLRSTSDGLFIKSELKITTVILAIILIIFVPLEVSEQHYVFNGKHFILVIGVFCIFLASSTYPVYRSYNTTPSKPQFEDVRDIVIQLTCATNDSSPKRQLTLEEVLDHGELKKCFMELQRREFCAENLMFHDACGAFMKHSQSENISDAELNSQALLIFSQFIKAGAPLSINISSNSTDAIRRVITKLTGLEDIDILCAENLSEIEQQCTGVVSGEIFEAAKEEVMILMHTDIFPRFVIEMNGAHKFEGAL